MQGGVQWGSRLGRGVLLLDAAAAAAGPGDDGGVLPPQFLAGYEAAEGAAGGANVIAVCLGGDVDHVVRVVGG